MKSFRKAIYAFGLGLAGLTGVAQVQSLEEMEQRARFIAEHPILGRIIQDENRNVSVPLRRMTNSTRASRVGSKSAQAPTLPDVWANMINSSAWSGRYAPYGIYQFRPGNPMEFSVLAKGSKSYMSGNGGAILLGDRYYVLNWVSSFGMLDLTYTIYDANTWEKISTKSSNDHGPAATDLAYDRLSNIVYGCFFRDDLSGYELGTVEYNDDYPVKTTIGKLPLMAVALGVNKSGTLYGILEDGVLYEIDKKDASLTRVGDTGIKIAGNGGIRQMTGEFDQNRDIFYWAANDIYGNWTLYTVDVTDGTVTEITEIPDSSQLLNMQVMAPAAGEKAPGELTHYNVSFTGTATVGDVSFTAPAFTYDGSMLNGSLVYKVAVDGAVEAQGECTVGEDVITTISAAQGMRLIEAWVENEEGRSPSVSSNMWVGHDVPVLSEVTLETNDHIATIKWKTAANSAHGGCTTGAWYDVTRMPDGEPVVEGLEANEFIDEIPEDAPMQQYYYVVTPCNVGVKGESMSSNSKLVGAALTVPYKQKFDTEADFNMMTVVNANKDDLTWTYNPYYDKQCACIDMLSSEDSDFDDWLLTPNIKVEAGKQYKVSFNIWSSEGYSKDRFEVKYGSGDDLSTFKSLVPLFNPTWLKHETKTATFRADKDEEIRLGFHRLTPVIYGSMELDDIVIEEVSADVAPGPVSNLSIVPGEFGALHANVSFETPTVDKAGNPLSSISETVIYVDDEPVATVSTPEMGTRYETKVDIKNPGFHYIGVASHNDGGKGIDAEERIYVGEDKPVVKNVVVSDGGDHINISWELAETGYYGYYVNPANVTYTLYLPDGNGYFSPVEEGITSTSLTMDYDPGSGPQGMIKVGIEAQNSVSYSNLASSNALVVGAPYTLPYEEHFVNSQYNYEMRTSTFFNIGTGVSSDGDDSCLVWMSGFDKSDDYKSISTLKISLAGNESPRLSFDYLPGGGEIEVYVMTRNLEETLIGKFNEVTVDSWPSATCDLSQWNNEPYIRLIFRMVAGTDRGTMALDNIIIQDVVNENLDVTLSLSNSEVPYGKSTDIFATVTNRGLNTSGDYAVNFYVNDGLIESISDTGLAFAHTKDYHVALPITLDMPKLLNVKVEVTYPADERPSNNVACATIDVLDPKVSAPENLDGENMEDGVHLSWEAPSKFYSEDVIDEFESYAAWSIFKIGDWKLVDADNASVITIGNGDYPNAGRRQSWTVFNPASIGMTSDIVAGRPHSGSQYLACFTADVNEVEHNDDWLISPILTGETQTITFYAKTLFADATETLQVMKSSNGNEIEDFDVVEEFQISGNMSWKRYDVELPAGTNYFALRCVTRDGNVLLVDDISYTAGSCHDIVTYRIYGDNSIIAETADTSYVDTVSKARLYNVTAIYATGEESAYSNTFSKDGSSVNMIACGGIALYDIYSLDGMIVCLKGESSAHLESGIYVVNGQKVKFIK